MEDPLSRITCHVKAHRQAKGWSQAQLADAVGVKRQAIYDIESGRYLPNTGVALRMAKILDCSVENLFSEEAPGQVVDMNLSGEEPNGVSRLLAARIRGRFVGLPMTENFLLNRGFPAADALLEPDGRSARLNCSLDLIDKTIFLFGCDPAFSILRDHVGRAFPGARVHCCFASSYASMQAVSKGLAHVGGVHLHNSSDGESNVTLAREMLGGMGGKVVGFTTMEEGLMVGAGNPHGIRGIDDLCSKNLRFVNRECGAALRVLLDDHLERAGLPKESLNGYDAEVRNHNDGARRVAGGLADAALGLHGVAAMFGLHFVPLAAVRCDLVIPDDIMDHPTVRIMLDVLQTRALRHDITRVPGYETTVSGTLIDTL
jgi:molybdate-binding protein/DNA-binding XRE family transcriptional regulator